MLDHGHTIYNVSVTQVQPRNCLCHYTAELILRVSTNALMVTDIVYESRAGCRLRCIL